MISNSETLMDPAHGGALAHESGEGLAPELDEAGPPVWGGVDPGPDPSAQVGAGWRSLLPGGDEIVERIVRVGHGLSPPGAAVGTV